MGSATVHCSLLTCAIASRGSASLSAGIASNLTSGDWSVTCVREGLGVRRYSRWATHRHGSCIQTPPRVASHKRDASHSHSEGTHLGEQHLQLGMNKEMFVKGRAQAVMVHELIALKAEEPSS